MCEKNLKEMGKSKKTDNTDVIPALSEGIVCRSWGNYGSSVYDPFPLQFEEFLEFYICDECLKSKANFINWIQLQKEVKNVSLKKFSQKLKEK